MKSMFSAVSLFVASPKAKPNGTRHPAVARGQTTSRAL
jgi:hypothetical protein